ncbi:MAG: hypothetical protein LBU14_06555 [Candidatus Peribacteria bacterium]|nr:hypothetical protein [Candidatus Peribacteria bacterium]
MFSKTPPCPSDIPPHPSGARIVFLLTFQILLYSYSTLASPSVSTEITSQSAL